MFLTKSEIQLSEKVEISKQASIELKEILKKITKAIKPLASDKLNIRVENSSLIFNIYNLVEIKLNKKVNSKFNNFSFEIAGLMFEKNSTLVKSEIIAFDLVNRIILADKNIISAYNKNRTSNEFVSFSEGCLCEQDYSETITSKFFEIISVDDKDILESLKELGIKKARKVKEIKSNELYEVESLEETSETNIISIDDRLEKKKIKQETQVIEITQDMSKSNIMKLAHRLAKTYEGNYRACLSLAMKEIYSQIRSLKEIKAA